MKKVIELVLLWVRWIVGRMPAALTYGVRGQSMVEYGIVVALIAIVAFATIKFLGQGIQGVFQNIVNGLQGIGI